MIQHKSYIVCRTDHSAQTKDIIIVTEFPVTSCDLLNIQDNLICSFAADTTHMACQLALNWLKKQTYKNMSHLGYDS